MAQEKEIVEYKKQVSFVQQKADDLSIVTESDMSIGSDLLNDVKKVEESIKERKEAITRPMMESLASTRELFKPLETAHAEAKKTIKSKMLAFTVAESERVEKEKARVMARAEKGTIRTDTAINKLEAIGETKKSFAGNSSKTSVRTVTKVRVIDESLLPREYLIPNITKITEALMKQKIAVPGAETYEEKSIVSNSR